MMTSQNLFDPPTEHYTLVDDPTRDEETLRGRSVDDAGVDEEEDEDIDEDAEDDDDDLDEDEEDEDDEDDEDDEEELDDEETEDDTGGA